jgi:phage terminase small subunit
MARKPKRKGITTGRGPGKAALEPKFWQHYLSNGHNATAAAIAVGYAPSAARQRGYEMLVRLRDSGKLAEAARRTAETAELETSRTLLEVKRILEFDPANLFDELGNALPIHHLDPATRAAIQSFELNEEGRPVKVKFWSKIEAASLAMKHLGLFERDNRQRQENLAIQINLVGAPAAQEPREVAVQATLVKPNGKNGSHP